VKIVWELRSLLKRNLWIVTGKGGVGKTTLAAALGLLAASEGLKVLLVETHGLSHLGELLQVGTVGYDPVKVRNNLSLVQINPEDAFEEYVLQQVKFKFVYDTIFKNRYVRHFIDAAPGLTELLTIGKIWALVESKAQKGKRRPYDLVVVDAPSTGHGLSLLTIPQVVVDAVRMGPLHSKAKDILDLLRNPQKTLVWLATLPEEMPVNEAVEMEEKLENQAKMEIGPLLLNGVWPTLLSPETEASFRGAAESEMLWAYRRRRENSRFYAEKLQERLFQKQILELPLIYQTQTPLKIAEHLMAAIKSELLAGAQHAVNQ
jgi:anion-transporting  ArsA/GET3 family ATPase